MTTLDDLKQYLPKSKQHLLDKAYALGENEAGLKLLSKPAPAVMSPAGLPDLQRNIMYHALLVHVQHLQADWYLTDLDRADRMRVSQMKQTAANNFNFLADLLGRKLKIKDTQGQLSDKEAARHFLESYQTLLWEVFDTLMRSNDPVKFVGMMQLLASGIARIEEEETISTAVPA